MPTYDYVCSACGHRIEVVHGIQGHGPAACPVCGGPMRKALNVPAVHFKGSGWAKKDRRAAASTKAAAKTAAGGEASPTKTGDASGGAEPAAATDTGRSDGPAASKGSAEPAGTGTTSTTSSGGTD